MRREAGPLRWNAIGPGFPAAAEAFKTSPRRLRFAESVRMENVCLDLADGLKNGEKMVDDFKI